MLPALLARIRQFGNRRAKKEDGWYFWRSQGLRSPATAVQSPIAAFSAVSRFRPFRSAVRAILSLSQCGLFEREMVHPNTCVFSSAISWWSELPIATRNQGQAILSYMNVIGFGPWHVFGPCAGRIRLLWLSPERRRKRFGSLFGARIRAPIAFQSRRRRSRDRMDGLLNF